MKLNLTDGAKTFEVGLELLLSDLDWDSADKDLVGHKAAQIPSCQGCNVGLGWRFRLGKTICGR
jgi:hypothetical protein